MSKHTPGPWKAEGDEHGHWVCLPGKDTFVCEMANEVSFDEVGANARLIAAAPDMLKALKDTLFGIRQVMPSNGELRASDALQMLPACVDALQHAIAKAESV